MAKRKTPKVKDVIDITPKPEKVTEEQLSKIKQSQEDIAQLRANVNLAKQKGN